MFFFYSPVLVSVLVLLVFVVVGRVPRQNVLGSNDTIRNCRLILLLPIQYYRWKYCMPITTLFFVLCATTVYNMGISSIARHWEDYCRDYNLVCTLIFYLKFQYNKSKNISKLVYIVVVASFFQDPRECNQLLTLIPLFWVLKMEGATE